MSEIPQNILDLQKQLDAYYALNPQHAPKVKKNKSKSKTSQILELLQKQNERLEALENQNKLLQEQLNNQRKIEEPKPIEIVEEPKVIHTTKTKTKSRTNKHKKGYNRIKQEFKERGYKGYRIKRIINKLRKWSGEEPKAEYYEKIKYKGNRVVGFFFNQPRGKESIRMTTNNLSQYLKRKDVGGFVSNSIFYPDLAWKSSKFIKLGFGVDMHDATYNGTIEYKEPEEYGKYVIYVILEDKEQLEQPQEEEINNEPIMGADYNKNDCLYYCLNYVLGSKNPFKTPLALKKFCKVGEFQKIPLTAIPLIETKLKDFAINVSGDFEYISPIKSNKIIYLKLVDEHIKIDYKRANKHTLCRSEEKQIVIYDKVSKLCYDGETERELTLQQKYDYEFNHNSKYLLVYRNHITNKVRKTGLFKSLKEEYDELITEFNNIKQATNGEINFFKTGSIKLTAQTLFNKLSLFLSTPEDLADYEHKWIKLSTCGALSYCNDKYSGKLQCYDINSMYGGILLSPNKLAIKRGELKTLTKAEFDNIKYFPFGIYRAEIIKSSNQNVNKFFRYNQNNYYTHTSLEHARSLNLNIELIEDGEPNNLFYSRDKIITFNEVFSKYVNYLYDLKVKKVSPYIKQLLNILWGSFCEINKAKKYIGSKSEKDLIIGNDYEIESIRPTTLNDDLLCVKIVKKSSNYYKTPYARICPFILSIGRKRMSDLFYAYADKIQYIRCDGIKCVEKLDITTGDKIGELRYEGYYSNATIHNLNHIEGEYIEM